MNMQENIMKYVADRLNYDYAHNTEVLINICKQCEDKSLILGDEEQQLLLEMKMRCLQIEELQKSFHLDISELNSKEYIINPEYAGMIFLTDIEEWNDCFERAKSGDAAMALLLGNCFREGKFSKPMTVYASKWYQIAADCGYEEGMYELALCYRWGEGGVYVDADKAIFWMTKAAEKGNERAKSFVEQFDNNSGRSIIVQSAISGVGGYGSKWYKCEELIEEYFKLADSGDAEAQYELARQSIPGEQFDVFKRDAHNAEKYYKMAAGQGMIDAMFNLANLYVEGSIGFAPDIEKGFEWRKKCADSGDDEACYLLGKMYRDGQGTQVDMEQCISYWRKAADNGFEPAVNAFRNRKDIV